MRRQDKDWFEKYLDEKFRNIGNRLNRIDSELKKKACKEDVVELKAEIRNIKLASMIVGAFGGLLTALGAYFTRALAIRG